MRWLPKGDVLGLILFLSVAAKKRVPKWRRSGPLPEEPFGVAFPSSQKCCPERPGAVKGAPLLGAAKRTLDGEDRSEMIAEEGKAGRKIGEMWSAILVPSPAASNMFLNEILRTERGMKSLRDAYLRGIQRLSSFATLP